MAGFASLYAKLIGEIKQMNEEQFQKHMAW
jgi:hypothetical protein